MYVYIHIYVLYIYVYSLYTAINMYTSTRLYRKYISIHIYILTWLWIKTLVVGGPPPLLQTFVAGPLLQTLVADLCVEYCSLQGACRGGVCRRTPLSATQLCREMAAQACYKANVFDSLPHMYMCTYIRLYIHLSTYMYVCVPGNLYLDHSTIKL